MIEVRRLTLKAGKTAILNELDLFINFGECVALTGRSGAGKSTFLHALLGDVERGSNGSTAQASVVSGIIRVEGLEVNGASSAKLGFLRRNVMAMVPQRLGGSLNPQFTARQHLKEAASLCKE